MGTELKTNMKDHTVVIFWGGDQRGMCLQITASGPLTVCNSIGEQLQEEGHIQLTMEEASALCNNLTAFVKREAVRRQGLLREEIKKAKIVERTILHEVAELSSELMAGPELVVTMVSRFCPKAPTEEVKE